MSATTRALDIAELELAALRMGRRQRIVGIAMSPAVDGYLRRDPSGKKQDGKGLIDPTEVLGEMAYCQRIIDPRMSNRKVQIYFSLKAWKARVEEQRRFDEGLL